MRKLVHVVRLRQLSAGLDGFVCYILVAEFIKIWWFRCKHLQKWSPGLKYLNGMMCWESCNVCICKLLYCEYKNLKTFPRFSSGRPAASWTSTPDLGNLNDDTRAEITTVSFTLPRRRVPPVDTGQGTWTVGVQWNYLWICGVLLNLHTKKRKNEICLCNKFGSDYKKQVLFEEMLCRKFTILTHYILKNMAHCETRKSH
jgi:hypothetical protein